MLLLAKWDGGKSWLCAHHVVDFTITYVLYWIGCAHAQEVRWGGTMASIITILALLCVVATKFLTSVRLRGLRAKFDSIQPEIDALHAQVTESEEKLEELGLKVEEKEALLSNLADAVRILDESLKRSVRDINAQDRVQLAERGAQE